MLIEVTKQSFIGYECSQIENGLVYVLFRDLVEEKEDSLVVDECSIIVDATQEMVDSNPDFYKTLAKKEEQEKKITKAHQSLSSTDWVEVQLNRYALVYGINSAEYREKLESRRELLAQRMEWEAIVRGEV